MKYFPTTETVTVTDYPYGRLRATVYYSLEFDKKKGFRSVFQSINPKTGRLNAPKKSTYSAIELMYRDEENGHIKYAAFHDLNGAEQINKGVKWVADKAHYFTQEQRLFILKHIQVMVLCTAKAQVVYCGADGGKVMEILLPTLAAVKHGIDEGGLPGCFEDIYVDVSALDATKVEGFSPFKTVTYEM